MSVIANPSSDTVRRDDGGARRRRITRKSVSMFILLTFTVIYVGPILMLVFASFKSLPEFFKDPTWLPDNLEWTTTQKLGAWRTSRVTC